MVTIKKTSDGVERLTLAPALPHQSLVGLCVLNPRPALHEQHPPSIRESRCCIDQLNPPPEADACRVPKADIGVDLSSLHCQYYWPCYTDSPQKRTLIYQGF